MCRICALFGQMVLKRDHFLFICGIIMYDLRPHCDVRGLWYTTGVKYWQFDLYIMLLKELRILSSSVIQFVLSWLFLTRPRSLHWFLYKQL